MKESKATREGRKSYHTTAWALHQKPYLFSVHSIPRYKVSGFFLGSYVFTVVVLSTSSELNSLSRLAALALVSSFITDFVASRQRILPYPSELKPFTGFLFLMVVSGLWAIDFTSWYVRTFTFFQLLIFAVVAINILQGQGKVIPVVTGIVIGLIWAVFISLQNNNFDMFAPHIYRPGSVLENPNIYAISLFTGIAMIALIFEGINRNILKILLILICLIFAQQIIFFGGSRKVMISLIITLPLFLSFHRIMFGQSSGHKVIFVVIGLIMFILITIWIIEYSPYYYRFSEIKEELSVGKRGNMIEFGLAKWQEKPFLGFGGNQYRILYAQSGFGNRYAHNNYVEILVNNGLLGLITFYSFFIIVLKKSWKRFKQGSLSATEASWIYVIVINLLIWDFGLVSYYDKFVWIIYIIIIFLLNKTSDLKSTSEPS